MTYCLSIWKYDYCTWLLCPSTKQSIWLSEETELKLPKWSRINWQDLKGVPSKYSSWWSHLEDVFCPRLQKTFWRLLQDVLIKMNIFALVTHLQKMSSRRLAKMFSRHLQDVLKTSCKNLLKTSSRRLKDVLKTSWRRLQDIFKTSFQNILKASSKRL